jgi:hypothetical protein
MPFGASQARLQQAVFDRLGEDAAWSGSVTATVRVRRRDADEEVGFVHGTALVDGHRIKVRKSEVPAPVEGDRVQILDEAGAPVDGALYAVAGEPKLDRKGVWTCLVELVSE